MRVYSRMLFRPAPGIFCASPIVTYLDLWNGNDPRS